MSPRLPAAPRFPTHSHLLRTTALVSLLSTLTAMHPGQAYATYTLDNASPGTSSLRAMSGPWDASSQIWYNDVSDQWEALANGGTAIEDPPGVREGNGMKMYLAYLRDPAGNKLCALHRM